MKRTALRGAYALAFALLALVAATGAATAQLPGLPSLVPKRDGARTDPPRRVDAQSPDDAKATADRRQSDNGADRDRPPAPPPEGIADAELAAQRDAQATMAGVRERKAFVDGELARLRKERSEAVAADQAWNGFPDPPPYSILRIDEWRDASEVLAARIGVLKAAIRHLDNELERAQAEIRRADEAVRRANDAHDAARDDAGRARALWRRDLADLQLRTAGAAAALARVAREARSEDLAARQAELRRLERQIAVARQQTRFDATDLEHALRRLQDDAAAAVQERRRLGRLLQERMRQRDAAARQVEKGAAGTPDRAAAEARLRAAQAWVDTLKLEDEMQAGLSRLADAMGEAWEQRRLVFASTDPAARRAAAQRLRAATELLVPWRNYIAILVNEARTQVRAAEVGLAANDTPANASPDADALQVARYSLTAYERAQTVIDAADRTLKRWIADGEAAEKQQDWRTRVINAWLTLQDGARALWAFELFAVEDSMMVDGQHVTTSRGVTVGKSVGALLLFMFGYWVVGRAARQTERWLVRRGLNAARVRTVRRWTVALMAFALALLTLNLARIPLTVFAFLGGALAIGVGFGTQTIIRNFISGMIVLFERRVQIGDIIEVDGVTGTVTSVDLRSSTVRSAEGLETLVPNSALLEQKVTNWTLYDRKVRRVVKVGVAYGTPMRAAAEAIEDCAKRHGNVLRDPAPIVIFEDFGDSAQVLALYFWIELSDRVNSLQVASDLRFMIEKRFADDGIIIAFPQREVRFDAARPVKVEVVAGPHR